MPITIKCLICGTQKTYSPSQVGKYCSRACYEKSKLGKPAWNKGLKNWMSEEHYNKLVQGTIDRNTRHPISSQQARINGMKSIPPSGQFHYKWNGGKKFSRFGYIYVLFKKHPRATKSGYVFEHILIMEKFLGRNIKPKEIIHHKNGIRHDNRIENLMIVDRSLHVKYHKSLKKGLIESIYK